MSAGDASPGSRAGHPGVSETVEVVVGVIGRAHGLRGDVAVELRTDEPETRFAPGAHLRGEGGQQVLTVVSRRALAANRLAVRFEQVDDRTAAEALRGRVLVVDVDLHERPADEEEFYDRQLRGLTVLDAAGAQIGTVTDVLHLPSQDVLAVDTETGERLVPFVTELVPRVDLAAGTCTLADVPGLLDDEE